MSIFPFAIYRRTAGIVRETMWKIGNCRFGRNSLKPHGIVRLAEANEFILTVIVLWTQTLFEVLIKIPTLPSV